MALNELVPTFRVFFKTVFHGENSKVTLQLATVVLERVVLLYGMPSFVSAVQEVVSKQMLQIYQLHPTLIVDQHRDILDFLGNLRTLTAGGEHCYIHLVRWVVVM